MQQPYAANTLGRRSPVVSGVGFLCDVTLRLLKNVAKTPIYFWAYIGALLYMTHRLSYRYGITSKYCVVGGKRVLLTSVEEDVAQNLINLENLQDDFTSVGGLEEVKLILTEHVLWPFKRPDLFTGKTVRSHPKGVLFFGPPGTGKTLLARALAKELGCSFINVNIESIFSKWVGDTEKNAAAIFTLAAKIAPCVIFIDEIDSLLSDRSTQDSATHTHAKTIFMTQWDGLEKSKAQIIVVGATNRRFTIDDAIRRRMPLQLEVPPPDQQAREKIFRIVLEHDLDGNPHKEDLIHYVALKTERYTGSDITELCKAAALMPLRECLSEGSVIPPLTQQHFDEALKRVKASTYSPSL